MQSQENYTRHVVTALILTLAILVVFQIYILREPERIAADERHDQSHAVDVGRDLFFDNCTLCHGQRGEGDVGPVLNDKPFLAENSDERIYSLIATGVPGTEMPAWGQAYGGPFTDEQIRQLVALMRSWEPKAIDHQAPLEPPDAARGQVIFETKCVTCHGEDGQGTDDAPRLNDPENLSKFDDDWYINTITHGRPAQGMPTWGTVLSPQDIRDVVAMFRSWQSEASSQP